MMRLSEEQSDSLKFSSLLIDLDEEEYGRFLQLARKISYTKGDFILREGERSDDLYVILSGSVALIRARDNLSEDNYLIDKLGAGQSIGEMRLTYDRPCSLSVIAEEPTEVIAVSISQLNKPEYRSCFISLLQSVNRILSNRLFSANELIVKHENEHSKEKNQQIYLFTMITVLIFLLIGLIMKIY